MFKKLLAIVLTYVILMASALALEVNKATELELQSIKGVGPSLASKIVKQRTIKVFASWEDFIARVPGVADKKATALSEGGLTVNQQAYKTDVQTNTKQTPVPNAQTSTTQTPAPDANTNTTK